MEVAEHNQQVKLLSEFWELMLQTKPVASTDRLFSTCRRRSDLIRAVRAAINRWRRASI
jgi:hypothetical protein